MGTLINHLNSFSQPMDPFFLDWAKTTFPDDTTPESMWAGCPRGYWLLEYAGNRGLGRDFLGRRLLVRAACACAHRALAHVPPSEHKFAEMLIMKTEQWCNHTLLGGGSQQAKETQEVLAQLVRSADQAEKKIADWPRSDAKHALAAAVAVVRAAAGAAYADNSDEQENVACFRVRSFSKMAAVEVELIAGMHQQCADAIRDDVIKYANLAPLT